MARLIDADRLLMRIEAELAQYRLNVADPDTDTSVLMLIWLAEQIEVMAKKADGVAA